MSGKCTMGAGGVTVLLGRGNPLSLLQLEVAQGDALMVVAATCYALYGVMLKRWAMNLPPWVMLYAQVCFAVLFLLPPYLMGPMTPVDGKTGCAPRRWVRTWSTRSF